MQKKLLLTEQNQLIEFSDEFYNLAKKIYEEEKEYQARTGDYDCPLDPQVEQRLNELCQEYQERYNHKNNYYIWFALQDHFDGHNDFVDLNKVSLEEIAEWYAEEAAQNTLKVG